MPSLKSRGLPLARASVQLDALRKLPTIPSFEQTLRAHGLTAARREKPSVLQLNLGKLCNQTCQHCHVDAGPDRREVMTRETMEDCLRLLRATDIPVVDLTGGAPELNPDFRWLVEQLRALGRHVIDRCNLTILETPKYRDLPEFFARHELELLCSLPHYLRPCTDRQRGDGVFASSLRGLTRLNAVGYGKGGALRLVLVTNPVGASLPTTQACLEREWKLELERRYDLHFDALYTITNMPISRYLEWLSESHELAAYMNLLVQSFNPAAVARVMCQSTLNVGWDGTLYDCDFNQQLELPLADDAPRNVRDLDVTTLDGLPIAVARHCYGCTAGAGSSCGGAVL